jgi:hypothetical protein
MIKTDAFYFEFQVKDFRFSPPDTPSDSPYLESMGFDIQWTNTDPRGGTKRIRGAGKHCQIGYM